MGIDYYPATREKNATIKATATGNVANGNGTERLIVTRVTVIRTSSTATVEQHGANGVPA